MEEIFNIDNSDTICAISTAPGIGGIAVIRVSGPDAIKAVARIWKGAKLNTLPSHSARYGLIVDGDETLDEAVVTLFRSPRSYTGDHVVEISVHGSTYVQRRMLRLLTDNGCRLAMPGEFTRRAFLAGKIDLAQSEAVADLISSSSRGAHRLARQQLKGTLSHQINRMRDNLVELASLLELEMDFSEEDVEFASRAKLIDLCTEIETTLRRLAASYSSGQAILKGLPVVIAGRPNAGKSTLLNSLLDDERAIVSDIPGTTRDIIEDVTEINGTLFRFIDTAGLRTDTSDIIERKGIDRALDRMEKASVILYLFDGKEISENHELTSQLITFQEVANKVSGQNSVIIPVLNKSDLLGDETRQSLVETLAKALKSLPVEIEITEPVTHSSVNTESLSHLKDKLIQVARKIVGDDSTDDIILTNERHYRALLTALDQLEKTRQSVSGSDTPDISSLYLREAIEALSAITGRVTTPEVLETIFSSFCIGK